MSEQNDGGAAFPIPYDAGHRDADGKHLWSDGMSLRDWFAGQIISGITSSPITDSKEAFNRVAELTYALADAMLLARTKPTGETK